jgi:PAS domain S-box-containing protein
LMLHKVEMEMQIEEMKRAFDESEDWRLRYQLLYESAPVGCVRVNLQGLVLGINITGTDMLGSPAAASIGQPFSRYIAPTRDSDRWHLLLTQKLGENTPAPVLFGLDMVRADGTHFSALLSARRLEMPGAQPQVHLAMLERP